VVEIVDMRLEVVVVPVSDVDRAKRFYETVGFRLDIDHVTGEDFGVRQRDHVGRSGRQRWQLQEVKTRAPGR
jgi:catechol 2,3-dioxygenase-like lactoylglutathione lyase family enzyme